jgi:hypothetical protein
VLIKRCELRKAIQPAAKVLEHVTIAQTRDQEQKPDFGAVGSGDDTSP